LWRGPALADVAEEPGVRREARRLEALRLRALESRIEADLAVGRHAELVAELEALVAAEPYRERFAQQLMLALYRCGRQPEALRVYAQTRSALHEDFGLEPTQALRELERQVLAQDPALDVPPASTDDSRGGSKAPRRRLRRLALAVVAVVPVVVGTLLAFSLLGRESESAALLARVDLNSVGVIDPERNALVAQVQVGVRPTRIAYGENAAWVANADDRTVSPIEPSMGRQLRAIRLDREPTDVAVGDAMVWIAAGRKTPSPAGYIDVAAVVVAVDPEFGTIAKQIRLPTTNSLTVPKIAVGDSGLWVTQGDQLYRLSPDDGRIASRTTIDPATDVAVGAGAVWTVHGLDFSESLPGGSALRRVDPDTEAVTATIHLGSGLPVVAIGEGAVWVAIEGAVLRIDPATPVVRTTIPVPGIPSDIAIGEGAVWVAAGDLGTVSRINPETDTVVATIRLGNRPDGIAVGAGKVWVTVY
jgi:DNA-binding beta-propeller fold protein YncE